MMAGAEVKADASGASVGGSAADASKVDCSYRLSKRGKRNAKWKRSEALVIPSPPLLRGRDERRTWRDPKNRAAPRISSHRNSERVVSKVCSGASRSGTVGLERRREIKRQLPKHERNSKSWI